MPTPLLPISIKWIVFEGDKVWMRRNERQERELPGGRLEEGEQPEETVIRELEEELGFEVKVVSCISAYVYAVPLPDGNTRDVFVVNYLCEKVSVVSDFEHIGEMGPAKFELIDVAKVDSEEMPEFYREAIKKAYK